MSCIRVLMAGVAFTAVTACTIKSERPVQDTIPSTKIERPPVANASPVVTVHGIGPIQVGMAFSEAAASLNGALAAKGSADPNSCQYADWRDAPKGVKIMVDEGRIARVEVDSGAIKTDAGAAIGDSEDQVKSLYPNQVTVMPHKYTSGHYLIVTPAAAADSANRIIFETDGHRVTQYRAGRRPQVEFVEGCS